ncbi:MAG: trypsin-like peptidase domain-containing protein [Nitrospinae bacterium]|nr:trypsin-like peptidase domain-containing protein [Nitrospinota bacterium]
MIYRLTISMLLILFMGSVAPAGANPGIDYMRKIEAAFTRIAESVKPTVVSIRVERKKGTAPQVPGSPHPNVPLFSSGSGVIIDGQGYILTNNHVISNARRLRVRLWDESAYWGKVVGTDRYTDLALIKINAHRRLPVAALGDSDKVKVGQWSIAVGDPFGITRTFTVGVVSGIGRSGVGVARYEHFIQTGAAINRGNSGGPLVNIGGRVIGINTAIPAPGSGIGFAIPVNMAKDVIKYLRRSGNFPRGYLGVTIQPVSRDMAYLLGLPKAKGALVGSLLKDGPAEGAGIRMGDVIVRLGGTSVVDTGHLQRLVGWTPPGEAVAVEVVRDARRKKFTVKLVRLPEPETGGKPAGNTKVDEPETRKSYGVALENLTDELKEKGNLQTDGGAYISDVEEGSRAYYDGLREGMVIRGLTYRLPGSGKAPIRVGIEKIEDIEALLKKIPAGSNVLGQVVRGTDRGERTFFTVLHGFKR